MKKKVLYIREGVFNPYKKGAAPKTSQDNIDAGKKLAKKAIIDNLIKTTLPKILLKALPPTIGMYRAYLNNKASNGKLINDVLGVVPISSWESKEYYSADTYTFGNEWDNTGIYIDHNGSNVDIMIPLVSKGISQSYIKLPIGTMSPSCNYANLLRFRSMLASSMAPEINELEEQMKSTGLKLDIKYYLTKASGDSDWTHIPEVTEMVITANNLFIEEQNAFTQENMQRGSNELFSDYIARQQFNGYGFITELLEYVKVPCIFWNSALSSKDMPVEEIADELGKICKVFNPRRVNFVIRAARRLKENRGKCNDAMDRLDSIASLVSSMPANSNLLLSFKYEYSCDQDFSDLHKDDTLISDKLCKEIFGMNHAEVVERVLYVLDAKETERDQNKGIICQRAYISEIEITVGSTLSSSQIDVTVAKVSTRATDITNRNSSNWTCTSATCCKWTR